MQDPFAPGPGSRPPVLAGRSELIERLIAATATTTRVPNPVGLLGARGVGKTATLNEFNLRANDAGHIVYFATASTTFEDGIAAQLLTNAPSLAEQVVGVSRRQAKRLTQSIQQVTAKVNLGVGSVEVKAAPEPGPGSPVLAATETVRQLCEATKNQALVIVVDEVQASNARDIHFLGSVIQTASRLGWPLMVVVAGLPYANQKLRDAGATSFLERIGWERLTNLDPGATRLALGDPLAQLKRPLMDSAATMAYQRTHGYPYAIQLLGSELFKATSSGEAVTVNHVDAAAHLMAERLEENLYTTYWERLTDLDRRFLHAAAQASAASPETSFQTSRIAEILNTRRQALSPRRQRLIDAGALHATGHGRMQFVTPGFDEWITTNHPAPEPN